MLLVWRWPCTLDKPVSILSVAILIDSTQKFIIFCSRKYALTPTPTVSYPYDRARIGPNRMSKMGKAFSTRTITILQAISSTCTQGLTRCMCCLENALQRKKSSQNHNTLCVEPKTEVIARGLTDSAITDSFNIRVGASLKDGYSLGDSYKWWLRALYAH